MLPSHRLDLMQPSWLAAGRGNHTIRPASLNVWLLSGPDHCGSGWLHERWPAKSDPGVTPGDAGMDDGVMLGGCAKTGSCTVQ